MVYIGSKRNADVCLYFKFLLNPRDASYFLRDNLIITDYLHTFFAVIKKGSWEVLPIFNLMQKKADIPERDMYNTFNMGIGMIVAVDADKAEKAVKCLEDAGEKAYIIGELVDGEKGVEIVGNNEVIS